MFTAAVSGEEEEGVSQQTVLGSGQQLLSEGVGVAAPVVHDGVPVAVRERKNSLEHSEEVGETNKTITFHLCQVMFGNYIN